jgi:hypothetical protein
MTSSPHQPDWEGRKNDFSFPRPSLSFLPTLYARIILRSH